MSKQLKELLAKSAAEYLQTLASGDDAKTMIVFTEAVTRFAHRTHQQDIFRLLVRIIKSHAAKKDADFDLRNEATVLLCRKIVAAVPELDAIPRL